VPDKSGSHPKGSARKLSETHRTAQEQGWDFKDLEVYIEDGDLQGFFVTYVRPHPSIKVFHESECQFRAVDQQADHSIDLQRTRLEISWTR